MHVFYTISYGMGVLRAATPARAQGGPENHFLKHLQKSRRNYTQKIRFEQFKASEPPGAFSEAENVRRPRHGMPFARVLPPSPMARGAVI